MYDTASWLPYTHLPAAEVHLSTTLGGGYQVGVGVRIDDWRDTAGTLGADHDWAAAEVMRIARETPARLAEQIDALPAPLRSAATPTRLLNANSPAQPPNLAPWAHGWGDARCRGGFLGTQRVHRCVLLLRLVACHR